LREDGYQRVAAGAVMPGDTILYIDDAGEPEHSGLVVHGPSRNPQHFGIPLIVSKWGAYAELIHWANHCPYNFAGAKYYRVVQI
jgi:hypothetical protein